MTQDPYIDPVTGVLHNLLGFTRGRVRSVRSTSPRPISSASTSTSRPTLRTCSPRWQRNYLRGLPREPFVDRLAHYFAEVNAIHPFREGNGRTQRAFFHQLCRMAGWPIDWTNLDPEANIAASMTSLHGDNGPLRSILEPLIVG